MIKSTKIFGCGCGGTKKPTTEKPKGTTEKPKK